MAKRKANIRSRPRSKPRRRSGWGYLFRYGLLPFALVLLTLGLVYWQWSNLTSGVTSIVDVVWGLFGWGLVFIAIAVVTLLGVVWGGKASSFIHHWNRWLGGIAFALAIWGILALFLMGGSFGLNIIGYVDFEGILRVAGLVVIGIIFLSQPGSTPNWVTVGPAFICTTLASTP